MSYILEQVVTRGNSAKWFASHYDDYDMYLRAGSAGELGRQRGLAQSGFWNKVVAHPSYDSFWQGQAMDKILAGQPVTVPTLLVHSLWDAEDIYGPIAVYKAIKPNDKENKVFLSIGPWSHGGAIGDGSTLGPIKFNADTALQWRQNVLAPFLARYLKGDASVPAIPTVTAFETGTNKWRNLASWPSGCEGGACAIKPVALRLAGEQKAVLGGSADARGYDEYISDLSKPVPFRQRPIPPYGYDEAKGQSWPRRLPPARGRGGIDRVPLQHAHRAAFLLHHLRRAHLRHGQLAALGALRGGERGLPRCADGRGTGGGAGHLAGWTQRHLGRDRTLRYSAY